MALAIPTSWASYQDAPVEFIEEVCGIYFRSILIKKGMLVPQHVHDHDHATYIGAGSARVWVNGEHMGDFPAGHAVPVKAGCFHQFEALEDNTRLACIHDVSSADSVKAKGL